MITVTDLTQRFGQKTILNNINLEFADGRTHALLGPSGCGKTTLLKTMLGLIPLTKGYVRFDGRMLSSFSLSELSAMIGYVPQAGGLFPHLTARENVTLVARLRKWASSKIDERLAELVSLVSIDTPILNQYPKQLSGGQIQRVAVMRALFLDPSILVLDEPLGALDPILRSELQTELKQIFKLLKKTVIIVTHDLAEASFLSDRVTLLHQGKISQTGDMRSLLVNPADEFVSKFIQAQRIWTGDGE